MVPQFRQEEGRVLANEPVARSIRLMRIEAPGIARAARPAQFVQCGAGEGGSPFLRRPFSFLRANAERGWFEIVYDIVGPGTRWLAERAEGHVVALVGPLGNPFAAPESGRVILVAGGVGVAPVSFMGWSAPDRTGEMVLLFGAATRHRMPDPERVIPPGLQRHLATEDGSLGHHGRVTELLGGHAGEGSATVVTCGPHAMMAHVARLTGDLGLPCYASLENHMACGFGACVGCVVERRNPAAVDERYTRVCVEGPVLDAHAIVW